MTDRFGRTRSTRTRHAGRRARTAALALALLLAACDAILGPVPVDIEVTGVPESLQPGQTVTLLARVTDADGREIRGADVEWSTSDASSATVERGVLRALEPGVVELSARVGVSTWATRVRIRFDGLGAGDLGVRVQGTRARHTGAGSAYLREPMAWESLGGAADRRPVETHVFSASGLDEVLAPGDYYGLFAEGFPADTVLWLSLQSAPAAGSRTYRTLLPEVRADGTLVPYVTDRAMLRVRDPQVPGRMTVYLAVEAITVDVGEYRAPRAGDLARTGTLRGSVSFEAAGLVIEDVAGGNPRVVGATGSNTTRVYGEFDLPVQSWPLGVVRATWNGGRFDADTALATIDPAWSTSGESWQVRWVSAIWQGPSTVDNLGMRLQFSPHAPDLRSLDPATFDHRADGTWVWGSLRVGNAGTLTDEGTLFSRDGDLEVRTFVAPSRTALGRLEGRLTATLARHGAAGRADGESVELRADIFAPLVPPQGPHRR